MFRGRAPKLRAGAQTPRRTIRRCNAAAANHGATAITARSSPDRRPPSRDDAGLRNLATFLGSSVRRRHFLDQRHFQDTGKSEGGPPMILGPLTLPPLPPIPAVGVTQYFPSLELEIPPSHTPNTTRAGVGLSKPLCERRMGVLHSSRPTPLPPGPCPPPVQRFRHTRTITRPPPAGHLGEG